MPPILVLSKKKYKMELVDASINPCIIRAAGIVKYPVLVASPNLRFILEINKNRVRMVVENRHSYYWYNYNVDSPPCYVKFNAESAVLQMASGDTLTLPKIGFEIGGYRLQYAIESKCLVENIMFANQRLHRVAKTYSSPPKNFFINFKEEEEISAKYNVRLWTSINDIFVIIEREHRRFFMLKNGHKHWIILIAFSVPFIITDEYYGRANPSVWKFSCNSPEEFIETFPEAS